MIANRPGLLGGGLLGGGRNISTLENGPHFTAVNIGKPLNCIL